ncbi:MAG: putative transporter [Fermentimonas sp.]|jgi:putative transport protein
MQYLYSFFGSQTAVTLFLLALVITIGVLLSKLKIKGVSLGTTWILFVGLFFGHLGVTLEAETLQLLKNAGLILFIYAIGIQVGPSFFSSFKHGGLALNRLAVFSVLITILITYTIFLTTDTPFPTLLGIMSGAVTNTPSMGAAQETYRSLTGTSMPDIAMGYAIAYPIAIIGILFSFGFLKRVFRIDMEEEDRKVEAENDHKDTEAHIYYLEVHNPAIFGKDMHYIKHVMDDKEFVISRIHYKATQEVQLVKSSTKLHALDRIVVVTNQKNIEALTALIGKRIEMNDAQWDKMDAQWVSRRMIVSAPRINGQTIGHLKLRNLYEVNITRIHRAGIDLVAHPDLQLKLGDRVTVVGKEETVAHVEHMLGNSEINLREPNLLIIFLGIVLGIVLGSISFTVPGMPQPVKLGLAGGALIMAILISNFGVKLKIITYNTASVNLMLREIGLSVFLACVGISAGGDFINTLVDGGYVWMAYAFLITVIPLIIVGIIARKKYKLNYYALTGLLAGCITFAPALSFIANSTKNDVPAVKYTTVYPLTMFLRVIVVQIMILLMPAL